MSNSLFSREYWSALVPSAAILAVLLAAAAVVERLNASRLAEPSDLRHAIDFFFITGFCVSGFVFGERCFPENLKDRRFLFLSSLPITRGALWISVVGGRSFAAWTVIGLTLSLRPSIGSSLSYAGLLWGAPSLGILCLAVHASLFSAGLSFALISRHVYLTYVVGPAAMTIALFSAALAMGYAFSYPWWSGVPEGASLSSLLQAEWFPFWVGSAMLLSALLTTRSYSTFKRGEFNSPRRRLVGALAVALIFFSFISAACWVVVCPLPLLAGPWRPALNFDFWPNGEKPVSASGTYIALIRQRTNQPRFKEVLIIDTRSGEVTGKARFRDAREWGWSHHGDMLNLLVVRDSPLDRWGFLAPGHVQLVRLSPKGKEISRQRLTGEVRLSRSGDVLVVREGGTGRVLIAKGTSGFAEVVRTPLTDGFRILSAGEGSLVLFHGGSRASRAWLVGKVVRELKMASRYAAAWWLDGVVIGNTYHLGRELPYEIPMGPNGPLRGFFVLPQFSDSVPVLTENLEPMGLFFLEFEAKGKSLGLWLKRNQKGSWKKLLRGLPIGDAYRKDPEFFLDRLSVVDAKWRPMIDFGTGSVVFAGESQGSRRFFLYDPKLDKVVEAPQACPRNQESRAELRRVDGLSGLMFLFACRRKVESWDASYFQFVPGAGAIRPLRMVSNQTKVPGIGGVLYCSEAGVMIVQKADGAWLFPVRGRPRRLWPPETNSSRKD